MWTSKAPARAERLDVFPCFRYAQAVAKTALIVGAGHR